MMRLAIALMLSLSVAAAHAEEPEMLEPIGDLIYCKSQEALSRPFSADECSLPKFGWPVEVLEKYGATAKVRVTPNVMSRSPVEAFVELGKLAPKGSQPKAKPELVEGALAYLCPTRAPAVDYWQLAEAGEMAQAEQVAKAGGCARLAPGERIGVFGQADPEVYQVSSKAKVGPVKTAVRGHLPRGAVR